MLWDLGISVTYETSYLPFLFPSLHDTPAADGPSSLSPSTALRPRGRRVFNKRGEEISPEVRGSSLHHMITALTVVASFPGLEFNRKRRSPRDHSSRGGRTDEKVATALDIVHWQRFSHREAGQKVQQRSFQER